MTTAVTITNSGSHDVVVNVVETDSPRDDGKTVLRYDLSPGASTEPITIYGWRRYVNVLETDPGI